MSETAAALHYQNRNYVRRHERFTVKTQARALFPQKSTLRGLDGPEVTVLDISQGGMAIEAALSDTIPEWFYVEFSQIGERLTCYVVGRSPGRVHAQFPRDISAETVRNIVDHARNTHMDAALDWLDSH
ncbi:MAG: PilZ domain-containing protein [Phyllobacteriaceae bacterium]|nr:PilZ domain-containing protein [Phyllobacteriaceae bacterium]